MSRKKTHSEVFIRLKVLRKEWGLSQKEMAVRANIATSTYQYYERGERDTPSEVLYLLTTYSVSAEWLLTGEGEMIQKPEKKIGIAENSTYIYKEGGAQGQLDDDPGIADLLESARRVLKSGNQVAFDALERNIRYFFHTIETEKELAGYKRRLVNHEKRLAALEGKKKDPDAVTEQKVM